MNKFKKHKTELILAQFNENVNHRGTIKTETSCRFAIEMPHPFNPDFLYLRISPSINVYNKESISIEYIETSTTFKISRVPPVLKNEEIIKMVSSSLQFLRHKMIKFNIVRKLDLNVPFSCQGNPAFTSKIRQGLVNIGFQIDNPLDSHTSISTLFD
jgi:hypothetical protein